MIGCLPGSSGRRDRSGFTLLEMILATALAAVLLAGVWSLMSIYLRLFETGQVKVERSQLVRALADQLADDLHSAIQDPLAGRKTGQPEGTAVRRFGLVGNQRQLRLDVLQVKPWLPSPETDFGEAPDLAGQGDADLRTVYYSFAPPGLMEEGEGLEQPGLVRRELDFQAPAEGTDFQSMEAEGSLAGEGGAEGAAGFATGSGDDTRLWVPEVADLQFRYFDGSGWTSSWNSLDRKSLPVAVEVRLRIADPGETSEAPASATPEVPDELASEVASAGFTHRLVIDMPGSPSYEGPRTPQPTTRPAERRPAVRIAPPPRWTPPSSESQPLPDQWMRTSP